MRRLFCILAFALFPWLLPAQDYTLFSYEGQVHIQDAQGAERSKRLNMPLHPDDRITVGPKSTVSIYDPRKEVVSVIGENKEENVLNLVGKPRWHLLGRIYHMYKGSDGSERAYASYKGDSPLPEFVYAARQDAYHGTYRVSLEVIDHSTGTVLAGSLDDGQQVHFRVENFEEFPLCIGIVWIDSAGNTLDCLAETGRYVLVPALGTVELEEAIIEVAPPYGTDRILLFASTELFDLGTFSDLYDQPASKPSTEVPIGFDIKRFAIR